ncbi:heavy metal translocating P-type ATPase [Alkaliphilus metalliredigens QYMF]|uniref:Cd(2+)-exporting ATPase n=1 Tax=Alkaliphilus metalliredigens (strain QYMF) TaxID=293826 RepID=A6TMD2_ALKMQ|nr:cation-translocating P-type ATPase [Alkaliphilus metalliredigens]ABR47350.1 heavy metal translocating P-type ATPase [Alkaliphilus metalliredigens QYMF]
MKVAIDFLKNEEKRTILFLILSAISLLISFFDIGNFKINAAWIAIILCGFPIIKGAVEGLIQNFDIKADVLVSIALVAAVFIGENFAAGEVALIMALGALLEERTVAKARAGIESLIHLTPRTARVLRDGVENIVPAEKVQIDDVLRVLPGETIAVDGVIISGQTSINQSVMTGESLPVDKAVGNEVSSGTVNQFGAFDMKATKVGENSSLQRMIKLVESADSSKAKIVGMADRWATWIVVIALVSAVGTWIITGEMIRAVTILVVFCPCALVLATPTAIMAGIGNATKFGILVREGDALERLSKVTKIAFDKTGTLTYGKPAVVAVHSFNSDISSEKLLTLTVSAELRSEHPLGKAIVSHFKNTSNKALVEPQEFTMIAGRGVKTTIEDDIIFAGNAELLLENGIVIPKDMMDKASTYRNDGCTIIYVAINGCKAGFLALSDTLRKDSPKMIRNLNALNVESILLTGDNRQAASHIGRNVGILTVHSECLPEDKMSAIEHYQNKNEMVCMVGDGINDAPALKKAYVGVAMGGIGSDIAVDAADIVLISDDIKSIPHLLSLSQKTMTTIKLNIVLSLLLNFIAIILAMIGVLGPVLGALVHNVGSVVVIINSAFLLNFKSNTDDSTLDSYKPAFSHVDA